MIWRLPIVLIVMSAAGWSGPAGASPPHFEPVPGGPRVEATQAIQAIPGGFVVGGPSGAWRVIGQSAEPLLRGHNVQALALDHAGGDLWLGTDSGLWRQHGHGGPLHEASLGPGGAQHVLSLATDRGRAIVGTTAGLWLVAAGGAPRAISVVPRREVASVVVSSAGIDVLVASSVYRLVADAGTASAPYRLMAVVQPVGAGRLLDLAAHGNRTWLLAERGVFRLEGGEARRITTGLPPGTDPTALAADEAGVWLASDRGLFHRAGGEAFRTAGATGVSFVDVDADGTQRFAVGPRGVWRDITGAGMPDANPVASAARTRPRPCIDSDAPSIAAVQRAVIQAQGLGLERLSRWRRRVEQRGALPEFELRFGLGGRRDRSSDRDQSFTSGAVRNLHDQSRDRERDFDVQASLRWDLGDARFHPEEIDVAREVREWIELRDEILDETGRLYFDRQAAAEACAQLPPGDPERAALTRRMNAAGAGLDAWTDGWWIHRSNP